MTTPLIAVKSISCSRPEGDPIFTNVSFTVNEGDIVVLQARSGAGKTTLLKCLAHLNLYQGAVEFQGRSPRFYGVPTYRTHVQYVPQRPSLLPGTPRDFMDTLATFHSRRIRNQGGASTLNLEHAIEVAKEWGIEESFWDRAWNTLSGGEAQRLALVIPYGLNCAEVLLLDEPTSALDAHTSELVEKALVAAVKSHDTTLKAIVWITHSEEQALRVGTRFLNLTPTGTHEDSAPAVP
ncbi:P-loop containing nucleoside triphosphate hydrolase protein [Artomyces pyxidatus]|uniref:P-loop containing nucleoside triphosphate hydrolase protein n=1 Tax=Artomyces pyxidatus TaxID=48021 RepID=A0ACB8T2B2_9AGAM|nr:P-loop containing nucleoside triphosphate hydrolase protein [Artomyces pyxidatus]